METTRIGLRDFRKDLTNVVHRVENGESFSLYFHDRLVAVVIPAAPANVNAQSEVAEGSSR